MAEYVIAIGKGFADLDPEIQKAIGSFLGFTSSLNSILGIGGTIVNILTDLGVAWIVFTGAKAAGVPAVFATAATALGAAGLGGAAAFVLPYLAALGTAWTAFEGGEAAARITGLDDAMTKLANSGGQVAQEALDRMDVSLRQLSTTADGPITSFDQLAETLRKGIPVWDGINQVWMTADGNLKILSSVAGQVATDMINLDRTVETSQGIWNAYKDSTELAAASVHDWGIVTTEAEQIAAAFKVGNLETIATFDKFGDSAEKAVGSADGFKGSMYLATTAAEYFGKGTQAAADESDKLKKSMDDLASTPLSIQFDVAGVEANAKIAGAALDTLAATIESTGTLLGTLFGLLANPDSINQDKILEQIAKENELRQQAVELTNKLTQQQIDYMQARTDALLKNDAMITIDGAGLQPHLEAFMWEILAAIQVRVNSDGLEMLVGV